MQKIHEEQQLKSQLIKYPHRLSRKGYANLEQEWVSKKKTTVPLFAFILFIKHDNIFTKVIILYMWMQCESHPETEEVDRSMTWVLARKDKAGKFLSDDVEEKAKEIVSY